MKKIKKIAAGLMAAAIAAAGMGSLTASAYVPSINRYTYFTLGQGFPATFNCSGFLSYTPSSASVGYYCSTTAPSNPLIQQVHVDGTLIFSDNGSACGGAYFGRYYINHTYSGYKVKNFRAVFGAKANVAYPSNNSSSIFV